MSCLNQIKEEKRREEKRREEKRREEKRKNIMKINILRNVFKPGMSGEKIGKYASKLQHNLTEVKNNVGKVNEKTKDIREKVKSLINLEPKKHKEIKKQTLEAKISKTEKEIRDVGKKILENIKKSKSNAVSNIEYLKSTSESIAARNSSQTGEFSIEINENSEKIQTDHIESFGDIEQGKIKLQAEIENINKLLNASSDEDISNSSKEISDLAKSMAGENTKFKDANARSLKKLLSLETKLEAAKIALKKNTEESHQYSITDDDKKDSMAKIAELKSKKIGYKKELKSLKSLEKQTKYLSDTIKSKEERRRKKSDQMSKPVLKANTQDPVKKIDDFTMFAVKTLDNSNKFGLTGNKSFDFDKYQNDLEKTSESLTDGLAEVKRELKEAESKLGIKPSFISRLLSGKLNPFKSSQKAAQTTGSTPSVDTSSTTSSQGASQLNEDSN